VIEKNIFQTFFTKELPRPVVEIISELRSNNPDYKYFFYDDNDIEEFVRDNYSTDILTAYNMLQIGAAKADFWRYLILYKKGGIYLDLDSCINKPLDSFLREDDGALITRERNAEYNKSFVQWCLFFKKGHPVLEKTIDYVAKKILENKEKRLDHITGPPIMSKAVEECYAHLNLSQCAYDTPDEEINKMLTPAKEDYARFYGYDYSGLCTFKHPQSFYLYEPYINKKPWMQEQQFKSVIRQ